MRGSLLSAPMFEMACRQLHVSRRLAADLVIEAACRRQQSNGRDRSRREQTSIFPIFSTSVWSRLIDLSAHFEPPSPSPKALLIMDLEE